MAARNFFADEEPRQTTELRLRATSNSATYQQRNTFRYDSNWILQQAADRQIPSCHQAVDPSLNNTGTIGASYIMQNINPGRYLYSNEFISFKINQTVNKI